MELPAHEAVDDVDLAAGFVLRNAQIEKSNANLTMIILVFLPPFERRTLGFGWNVCQIVCEILIIGPLEGFLSGKHNSHWSCQSMERG